MNSDNVVCNVVVIYLIRLIDHDVDKVKPRENCRRQCHIVLQWDEEKEKYYGNCLACNFSIMQNMQHNIENILLIYLACKQIPNIVQYYATNTQHWHVNILPIYLHPVKQLCRETKLPQPLTSKHLDFFKPKLNQHQVKKIELLGSNLYKLMK